MTDQPEALRLADAVDPLTRKGIDNLTCAAAAAELRRLHAENQSLRAALAQAEPVQCKPLTDEEIDAEWRELDGEASTMFMRVLRKFARAIERAHGIKESGNG